MEVEEVEVDCEVWGDIVRVGDGMVVEVEEGELEGVVGLVMVVELVEVVWEVVERVEEG